MSDERRKSEARSLIRARVAVWRAEVWTSRLPAIVVLPAVMIVWRDVPRIVEATVRGENEYLSYRLPDFGVNAAIFLGGLVILWLIRYALRGAATTMEHSKVRLGAANAVGRWLVRIVSFLAVVAVVLDTYGRFQSVPLDTAILGTLVETAYLAGGLILTCWVGIRRPVDVQCARCGYAIGSVRRASDVCPECRNRWKRVGGLRRFRRISIWWLVGGIGLLVMGGMVQALAW